MKRSMALLTLVGFLLLTGAAWAQGLPTAKPEEVGLSSERLQRVSRALRGEIEAGKIPGAVALVARKGRVVYFEGFGVRDKAVGDPMPKDAIFRLYSMTKPFTSVAAMMLMEDGRFLLIDPVSKFLPQLAKREVNTQQLDAATGKITYVLVPTDREMTIQDLLRHTSGLVYGGFTPNARIKELYAKDGVTWDNVTPDEQIQRLAKVPLAHQPGTTWEYSLSTDVLGRVIEKVSGTTLARILDERLFGPLKMSDTAFVVPADKVGRLAQPLAVEPSTGQSIKLVDVTVPPKNDAGGAGTAGTVGDYARFIQMLLNGGQLEGNRLLSPTTVAFMTSDHLGTMKIVPLGGVGTGYGFGLGFAVRKDPGIAGVSGPVGEYRWGGAAGTAFWVDPKDEMISVLMTQGAPGPARGQINTLFRQMVRQAIVE
ncbi:MAG: serine hydrolase domain-containing protein [Candidatus Rokuibacteriota bacterium]